MRLSKRLSFVLRHHPGSIGLELDPAGWVDVEALLGALAAHGTRIDRRALEQVVATNDKRRFAFDRSGTRIRASQGHSVQVDLGYPPQPPPPELFHGTPVRAVEAILEQGLRPQRRHAVHLSDDVATARTVGARRGRAVVLRVDAQALAAVGAVFARSDNGVWLVAAVPPEFLSLLDRV